jgi:hypothetical protein
VDPYPAAAAWLTRHGGWISILPRLDHPYAAAKGLPLMAGLRTT